MRYLKYLCLLLGIIGNNLFGFELNHELINLIQNLKQEIKELQERMAFLEEAYFYFQIEKMIE